MMNLLEMVKLLGMDNVDCLGYTSPLKLVAAGAILGFNSETRVIDLGCGRGEALALWGEYFNVSGIGVERCPNSSAVARQRLAEKNLSDRISIECTDAATYEIRHASYDVACCINASFIWGGFRGTLKQLKTAIKEDGAILIAEPYYTTKDIPQELRASEGDLHTQVELLDIIHEEGFELIFIKRASHDDADNYRARFRGELQRVAAEFMWPHYFGSALFAIKPRV